MVDIGDLIGTADQLPFLGFGQDRAGMSQNRHAHFVSKVQTFTAVFQQVHHPKALLIVAEFIAQALRKGALAGMTEGGMAQVMAHGTGFCQVLVQIQRPCHGPGDPGHLQGVGHTGAVVVAFRLQKHLGLMHQPAKGLTMYDPVGIPLVAGPHIVFHFCLFV